MYAPGVYTGYAAKAIPAVREGLEQKKWKQAEEAAARVAKVLQNEAQSSSAAAAAKLFRHVHLEIERPVCIRLQRDRQRC